MDKSKLLTALTNARAFLADPNHWTQGDWGDVVRSSEGTPIAAECACIMGAAYYGFYGENGLDDLIMDGANDEDTDAALGKIAYALAPHIWGDDPPYDALLGRPVELDEVDFFHVARWNDTPGRTHEEVLAVLDAAIAAQSEPAVSA